MEADFQYEPVRDAAGCQLEVTVLADRAHIRAEMREDAAAAGFRIRECCNLEEYAQGPLGALGDLVLVDCAEASADALATTLAKLVQPGDMVVCLGAGDITKWAAGLAAGIEAAR